jgi:hypothetical protein
MTKKTGPGSTKINPVLSEEFERNMDRVTGTVVRDGNSVTLLPSGVQSYEKRWELLARARRRVEVRNPEQKSFKPGRRRES